MGVPLVDAMPSTPHGHSTAPSSLMPDASKNLADAHLQWQRSHTVIPSGVDEALIVPRSGTPISFSRPSRRSVSPARRAPAPTPPCHSAPVEKSRSGSHRPAAICERSVTPRSGPRAHANGDTMVGFEGPPQTPCRDRAPGGMPCAPATGGDSCGGGRRLRDPHQWVQHAALLPPGVMASGIRRCPGPLALP